MQLALPPVLFSLIIVVAGGQTKEESSVMTNDNDAELGLIMDALTELMDRVTSLEVRKMTTEEYCDVVLEDLPDEAQREFMDFDMSLSGMFGKISQAKLQQMMRAMSIAGK
jgi:hypothetical protein